MIYGRSLQKKNEVRELRVREIIHLGPLVNKEQTKAEDGHICFRTPGTPGQQEHFEAMLPAQRVSAAGLFYE